MPWSYEASVVSRNGHDYWRTWFWEECDKEQLFGLTEKHLPLLTKSGEGFTAYEDGTKVFFEDAPYFRASTTHHRICGPYDVFPASLPDSATAIYRDSKGQVIVYKDPHPQTGPWLDKPSVTRYVDGLKLRFPQMAREFKFYPYRFGIRRSPHFKIELVQHQNNCWLCVNIRRRRY